MQSPLSAQLVNLRVVSFSIESINTLYFLLHSDNQELAMLPKKPQSPEQTQRWTFIQLSGLVKRNPLTISRWVFCWALVGTVCGIFAGLYWNVLELMTAAPEKFEGPSLLI